MTVLRAGLALLAFWLFALVSLVWFGASGAPPDAPSPLSTPVAQRLLPLVHQNVQPPIPPIDDVRIYDYEGTERDWDWLWSQFGDVQLQRGQDDAARLLELHESPPDSPATLVVEVLDAQGQPLAGVVVVRTWTGCDEALPPEYARCGATFGVWGLTNAEGRVGFGMGGGDYYQPPAAGASAVWLAVDGFDSDCLSGLGMLFGTNHVHLDSAWVFTP